LIVAPTNKKGPGQQKVPTDMSLLSKEDKASLRAEAQKSVLAEMEQEARDEYFRKELDKIRRSKTPAAQYVHVMLDLAPFLPYVMIDGVQYFHGYGYDVERHRALVLYEQMQRSWQHQDEIDGRSRFNPYRRASNTVIGPRHAAQATSGANGVVTLPDDMEV
jgi:hypothetical protein